MSGNLSGYVVRGQQPVTDATVTIVDGPGSHIDIAPVSDEDGWFVLDDLAPGRWRLRAQGPDGSTGEAQVDIWDDTLSEVTIYLDRGGEPQPDLGLTVDAEAPGDLPRS